MTDRTPRVAFYLRVSKDKQTTDNQRIELMRYAEFQQWTDITIFQDDGYSGSLGSQDRPGFKELLTRASRKEFDVVVAWSVDRLGREQKDCFEISSLAQRKGFRLYLFKENIDTSTPMGELYFTILAGLAKFERNRLIERVHAGLNRARIEGKTLGRPEFTDPRAKEKREKRGIVDAERQVKSLRAKGMGIKSIAKAVGIGVGSVYKILQEHQEKAAQL